MVDLITFNRVLNEGLKENFLEFRIDTNLVGFPEDHMINQKKHTHTDLCLYDIDVYNNN